MVSSVLAELSGKDEKLVWKRENALDFLSELYDHVNNKYKIQTMVHWKRLVQQELKMAKNDRSKSLKAVNLYAKKVWPILEDFSILTKVISLRYIELYITVQSGKLVVNAIKQLLSIAGDNSTKSVRAKAICREFFHGVLQISGKSADAAKEIIDNTLPIEDETDFKYTHNVISFFYVIRTTLYSTTIMYLNNSTLQHMPTVGEMEKEWESLVTEMNDLSVITQVVAPRNIDQVFFLVYLNMIWNGTSIIALDQISTTVDLNLCETFSKVLTTGVGKDKSLRFALEQFRDAYPMIHYYCKSEKIPFHMFPEARAVFLYCQHFCLGYHEGISDNSIVLFDLNVDKLKKAFKPEKFLDTHIEELEIILTNLQDSVVIPFQSTLILSDSPAGYQKCLNECLELAFERHDISVLQEQIAEREELTSSGMSMIFTNEVLSKLNEQLEAAKLPTTEIDNVTQTHALAIVGLSKRRLIPLREILECILDTEVDDEKSQALQWVHEVCFIRRTIILRAVSHAEEVLQIATSTRAPAKERAIALWHKQVERRVQLDMCSYGFDLVEKRKLYYAKQRLFEAKRQENEK